MKKGTIKSISSILIKKSLVVTASVCIAFAMVPFVDCTAIGFAGSGSAIAADAPEDDIFDFTDNRAEQKLVTAAGTLPEHVDLTDGSITGYKDARNIITPVKSQSPFGTCWAFAATAAAEGSVIGEKKLSGESVNPRNKKYDFSEKYLAWFTNTYIDDETSSQYGEGIHWKDGMTSSEMLNQGGMTFFATQQYSSGIGPTLEADYPYKGKNGRKVLRSYSAKDDWSIDESERYHQKYQLDESYVLPTPAGKGDDGGYEYNEAGTSAIKEELNCNRPVQIAFYADASVPGQAETGQYINLKTWAHYTYDRQGINHSACIVGYDDSYSKENFNEGHQPPADGAFLVKNSWGSEKEKFPNYNTGEWGIKDKDGDHTGYFWLSYYDKTLKHPEALNFNVEGVYEYYVEEYDYMPVDVPMAEISDDERSMANVYTAEANLRLFALSCQTSTPGTEVNFKVYTLDDSDSGTYPEAGELVYEGNETYKYGGFHKHLIENGPIVYQDEKYSVVVTQKNSDGQYITYMNGAEGKDLCEKCGLNYWTVAVVNRGESYLKSGDEWKDLCDIKEDGKKTSSIYYKYYEIDNFPIKAYGDEVHLMPYGEETTLETDTVDATILAEAMLEDIDGADDGSRNENLEDATESVGASGDRYSDDGYSGSAAENVATWISNNEKIATVAASADNRLGIITTKDYGKTYITANDETIGTATLKIIVRPEKIDIKAKGARKKMTVSWESTRSAEGYVIKYQKAGGKWKTAYRNAKATKAVLKNLRKGTYTVKVAAYAKNKKGKKVFGAYSTVAKVKVK